MVSWHDSETLPSSSKCTLPLPVITTPKVFIAMRSLLPSLLTQLSKNILNFMSESGVLVFWWLHHFCTLLWQCVISSQHSQFLEISKVASFLELWFPLVFLFHLKPNLNTISERKLYIIIHSTATKVLNCSCGHNQLKPSITKKKKKCESGSTY